MNLPIQDRASAGRELARALEEYRDRDPLIVLALPRGGVPVAAEIAEHLDAELDLMIVRKLGMPGHEELAMGAIASGGARVLNRQVLGYRDVSDEAIEKVAERERRELERREQTYRGDRPWPDMSDATVIIVDDGLATGSTMSAALEALKIHRPREIVVAVPVAPADTIENLRSNADNIVCLETPDNFNAIGQWYRDFHQVSDEEVRQLLDRFWNK
ncbi:phosphoribosyltransferase [Marinobacter vulgaris]|uniref:Phosphoribosyltransferase n=1 Tax=Marinobacter vulgaris TaxID=1928331 RepID=A0A2V3ZK93_9GAMM|nr:phosphoribosyltransferase [Marinobacter vulgaris]PXX90818.1 phosphoribosyltransferase [Marinobacter vulgaris]TSJ70205.1 phosphoribosyltransferase [Marinobacter vulgaris]